MTTNDKSKGFEFSNFMRNIFVQIGHFITHIIDWFYPPFSKFVSLTFFRYGVCGSSTMLFDWVLYYITFHFIVQKEVFYFFIVPLKPHVASLFITFPITLLVGFLLQKYVTFSASNLKGRYQLFRYFLIVVFNLLINYLGIRVLVDVLNVYPTPSKMIITTVTVTISYLSQKLFIFKIDNKLQK